MKLFALAATTAVTGRRVQEPAPGFVNEQGGYWADQTSDQSRHYQQAPQPSYQKPQCADGYFFTAPGAPETVFMEKIGENDEKPMYAGWFELRTSNFEGGTSIFKGGQKFLYWSWDRQSNPTNAIVQAVPGNWYFGSSVGDVNAIASTTTYGLRYCPTDQEVSWIQVSSLKENIVSLVAGQKPSDPMGGFKHTICCESLRMTSDGEPVVFYNSNKKVNGKDDERKYFQSVPHWHIPSDDTKYLYFMFDKDQNSPVPLPKPAQSGRWYISTGRYISTDRLVIFDDDKAIAVTESIEYGFTSCPNDALVIKTFSKNGDKIAVDLECNFNPDSLGKVGTCDRVHDSSMFPKNNKNECK